MDKGGEGFGARLINWKVRYIRTETLWKIILVKKRRKKY